MTNPSLSEIVSNGLIETSRFPNLSEKVDFYYTGKLGNGEIASFRISITGSSGKEVGYSEFMLKKNFVPFQVGGIYPDFTIMGRIENLIQDPNLKTPGLGTYLFERSLEISSLLKQKCIVKELIRNDSTVGLVIDVLNNKMSWTRNRCLQFKIPQLRGENHWGKLI